MKVRSKIPARVFAVLVTIMIAMALHPASGADASNEDYIVLLEDPVDDVVDDELDPYVLPDIDIVEAGARNLGNGTILVTIEVDGAIQPYEIGYKWEYKVLFYMDLYDDVTSEGDWDALIRYNGSLSNLYVRGEGYKDPVFTGGINSSTIMYYVPWEDIGNDGSFMITAVASFFNSSVIAEDLTFNARIRVDPFEGQRDDGSEWYAPYSLDQLFMIVASVLILAGIAVYINLKRRREPSHP